CARGAPGATVAASLFDSW
nr:immunoglobulin heavy chain junction region [Macaca mulatta]